MEDLKDMKEFSLGINAQLPFPKQAQDFEEDCD